LKERFYFLRDGNNSGSDRPVEAGGIALFATAGDLFAFGSRPLEISPGTGRGESASARLVATPGAESTAAAITRSVGIPEASCVGAAADA
jgi:hypothetical protein